jgi:hypothetical protein
MAGEILMSTLGRNNSAKVIQGLILSSEACLAKAVEMDLLAAAYTGYETNYHRLAERWRHLAEQAKWQDGRDFAQ